MVKNGTCETSRETKLKTLSETTEGAGGSELRRRERICVTVRRSSWVAEADLWSGSYTGSEVIGGFISKAL